MIEFVLIELNNILPKVNHSSVTHSTSNLSVYWLVLIKENLPQACEKRAESVMIPCQSYLFTSGTEIISLQKTLACIPQVSFLISRFPQNS